MITLLSSNRTGINVENLDLVTRQFMQLIESIHGFFVEGIDQVHKNFPDGNRTFDVNLLSKRIVQNLKGNYHRTSAGKEYLLLEENHQIPINFISSGQQEVLWLLNLLYVLMLKKEEAFVIIEEPEAHLYPSLQQEIINFISFFSNVNNSSVFITTHSPYVLTASNVYYYAGRLLDKFRELRKNDELFYTKKCAEIYNVIGKNRELFPEKFSAFKLNRDHSYQTLIEEELGEVSGEMIDEISEIINEMYMKLFNLEEVFGEN